MPTRARLDEIAKEVNAPEAATGETIEATEQAETTGMSTVSETAEPTTLPEGKLTPEAAVATG